VIGYTLGVRKIEDRRGGRGEVCEELCLSSAVPLAKLCSRDRGSTKSRCCYDRQARPGEEMSRRYYYWPALDGDNYVVSCEDV